MKDINITETDKNALLLNDSNHFVNKGANFYREETYPKAVEYYRLSAAMGNVKAISNLGYCYLYGRGIEPDTDLAILYFKLAAKRENIDASYKLGDIYSSDKWVKKDTELSVFYYRMAASFIIQDEWTKYNIIYAEDLLEYPSLCFALGREMSKDGNMATDLVCAYMFLKQAKHGYRLAIEDGDTFYEKAYENVLERLKDEQYDMVRSECDELFDDDEDDEFDEDVDCN